MKRVLDTSVWLEWFSRGERAADVRPFLDVENQITVPTIVLLEAYKWMERELGERAADQAIARMLVSAVEDLTPSVAILAARLCSLHRLATADAIVYAHARALGQDLVTLDHHFSTLPGVVYLAKGGRRTSS